MSTGALPGGASANIVQSGMVLLGTYTASASASLDCGTRNQAGWTGALFQSDFDDYVIEGVDIIAATNGSSLTMRVGTGAGPSYDSGANYDWTRVYSQIGSASTAATATAAATSATLMVLVSSTNTTHVTVKLRSPQNSSYNKLFEIFGSQRASDGAAYSNYGGAARYTPTTALTGLQFLMSAGNITSGSIYIYGVSKSASTAGSYGPAGRIVQVVNTQTGAVASGSTVIPIDDTIPQNTEGDQYMTLAITPTSATNKLKIEVVFFGAIAAPAEIIVALFQDTTANALATMSQYDDSGTGRRIISFSHYMTAGTTSSTTFKIRAGSHTGTALTFNGTGGARQYGGSLASSITITEIAV